MRAVAYGRVTFERFGRRQAPAPRRSPRDIALAHRFWDFGRLVKDYGEVFADDLRGLFGND